MTTNKTPTKAVKTAATKQAASVAPSSMKQPDPAVVAITETKTYADGTLVTGPGPLPDASPTEAGGTTDAVLAAAAAREPSPTPVITPPPLDLAEPQMTAATATAIDRRPRTLDAARSLPEMQHGLFADLPNDDPSVVRAFKDSDDRTMQVVVTPAGLAKFHMNDQ